MHVVYSNKHRLHIPGQVFERGSLRTSRDVPERVERLLVEAIKAGLEPILSEATSWTELAAVHSGRYIRFLESAYGEWSALGLDASLVQPSFFPVGTSVETYPGSVLGRAGIHMTDFLSPIGVHTFEAAVASANVAIRAALIVSENGSFSYALCRPPGHHAGIDAGGGATYFNNAALAAHTLLKKHARVAIIDIDVHHGNGTQEIFYERADVLFVSIHRDPADYYPYATGYASETGRGAGAGFNLNMPLHRGSDDQAYLTALIRAEEVIRAFNADALVVSLGFDAHEADPAKGLRISTSCFGAIGSRLGILSVPTVLVQEGGYNLDTLSDVFASFIINFANKHNGPIHE